MDADQVLAFRLARCGLAERDARGLSGAARCPISDFARDAALIALAARTESLTRAEFDAAVDAGGELVLAHVIRGAIHALAPAELALYGRALVSRRDDELATQLGQQVKRMAAEHGFSPAAALDEVAAATTEALANGAPLSKDELHEELRRRVSAELMPWCRSCKSHHVAPMLWRYATVAAGVRLDSERRYRLARPGKAPPASEAVRRFLAIYGPATPGEFAEWAGLASSHARRLWDQLDRELAEVEVGGRRAWALAADLEALGSPPQARGVRLIPPGDPFLQKPNRPLLASDEAVRKRLFRPVASPGAVLADGRLAGLWKVKAKGKKAEITVERLGRISRRALEPEAERIARLRDAELSLVVA